MRAADHSFSASKHVHTTGPATSSVIGRPRRLECQPNLTVGINPRAKRCAEETGILTLENFLLTPSQGARAHPRPSDNPRHWESTAHCGPPGGPDRTGVLRARCRVVGAQGGRVHSYVVSICWPARSGKPHCGTTRPIGTPRFEVVSQTFRFHPVRRSSKQRFSTGAHFC